MKFESGDDGEVGLEVVSEVSYRDGISVGKYIKVGVNMIIDNSVGWGANRGVGGEVKISEVGYLWRSMGLWIDVLAEVFMIGLIEALVTNQIVVFVMKLTNKLN